MLLCVRILFNHSVWQMYAAGMMSIFWRKSMQYTRWFFSIPFTSGNSFLQPQDSAERLRNFLCQSPSHRGTHFYVWKRSWDWVLSWCVNPLLIGELISTPVGGGVHIDQKMCQSPSHRGTHFYKFDGTDKASIEKVSIPFSSGNSFLPGHHVDSHKY